MTTLPALLWLKRNPWFEAELIPALRLRVSEALGATEATDDRS